MALLPVDEALERLISGAARLEAETIRIDEAAWRVLAADLRARRTQPPFAAASMDGYAVRSVDIVELPAFLEVIGHVPAGKTFCGEVGPGQTVRIFTGAPLPPGADTVLMQEDARVDSERRVEALASPSQGFHVRAVGLDFHEGDLVLQSGRVLDPAALSLAAAANHASLQVVRRPLVALLATGDELLPPGSEPGPGQIIASNGHGIAALAAADGADTLNLGIVADDPEKIAASIDRAREAGAHIIVTIGGASVGDHDLVREVLAGLGMELAFWKIAMRPGKPLMVGRLGATHVLGLPGNPVSGLVCAHLFLRPLIARLSGRQHLPDIRNAVLGSSMKQNDHRRDYVRATVHFGPAGLEATPFALQDSSMLTTLANADALIIRQPDAPAAPQGSACQVLMLR